MGQMHIVLYHPEIPQNTGNIARTCAATGAKLDLIRPLGFEISDKYLKRAGLDYWHMMELRVHDDWDAFRAAYPDAQLRFTTKKATHCYTEIDWPENPFIVFGPESTGLPEKLIKAEHERCFRIPMRSGARSLNLSNSVAIVAYEYLRTAGFDGLEMAGTLAPEPMEGEWQDYV